MRKTSNSVLSQYRGALMGISIILIIVFHFFGKIYFKNLILFAKIIFDNKNLQNR